MRNYYTTETFIAKAKLVHGDKYDYSGLVYKKSREKLKIICKKHGEFYQVSNSHLNGRGCTACGFEAMGKKCRKDHTEIDSFLKLNFPDKTKTLKYYASYFNVSCAFISARHKKLGLTRNHAKDFTHENLSGKTWKSLTKGAKDRGLEVSVTPDDIWKLYMRQNKKCRFTGKELSFHKNCNIIDGSVDRIDSNKGYTIDNIQIVHKIVNRMKNNSTDKDFWQYCDTISKYSSKDFNYWDNGWILDEWTDTIYPDFKKKIEIKQETEEEAWGWLKLA